MNVTFKQKFAEKFYSVVSPVSVMLLVFRNVFGSIMTFKCIHTYNRDKRLLNRTFLQQNKMNVILSNKIWRINSCISILQQIKLVGKIWSMHT